MKDIGQRSDMEPVRSPYEPPSAISSVEGLWKAEEGPKGLRRDCWFVGWRHNYFRFVSLLWYEKDANVDTHAGHGHGQGADEFDGE